MDPLTLVCIDSSAAVSRTTKRSVSKRKQHTDLKSHFIRQLKKYNIFRFQNELSSEQSAGMPTKAVGAGTFFNLSGLITTCFTMLLRQIYILLFHLLCALKNLSDEQVTCPY